MLQAKVKPDYNSGYLDNKKTQDYQAQNRNFRLFFFFLINLFLIAVLIVAYISQSVEKTQLNYQLAHLEKELANIKDNNHKIKLELAQKRSLAKIEKKAREELKMVEPEKIEVLVLNKQQPENLSIEPEKENWSFAGLINDFIEKIATVKAKEME